MSKLVTASVLAFERKLEISDATFDQKDSQNFNSKLSPVVVREKSVRGTISNRLKNTIANDPAKLDAEIQKANLQTIDVATLDEDKDTLVVKWSCKILPFDGKPSVCNDSTYQAKLLSTVGDYLQDLGVAELARRYANNIVNARWLWRNRMGAEAIQVKVNAQIDGEEQTLVFENVKSLSLNDFSWQHNDLETLRKWIVQGLTGEAFVILYIEAHVNVGYGQEVYPSQELILDKQDRKSKVLYEVNGKAGMHSQKVSNAIRTIDTWYAENVQFPIASEPYGAVTTLGTAFRQPKVKNDFYTLFDDWILKDKKPEVEQQHYVVSVLLRGGVFGSSGKE
ncbi:MAG: type I-F CRISPR-associated protein Csy3 [Pelistega sp.]|nr:type I-F CRISPR-associated protein Csy3 [Pelistega sp.]